MTIAPEGRFIVGGAVAVAALASWAWHFYAWPFWLAAVFVAQFFREPARDIHVGGEEIVSPADGKVIFIGKATPPGGGEEKLKISVFMNVFNVHANRSPAAGKVTRSERFPGKFFNAALDKSSAENERHLIAMDTARGEIICVQIAGLLARRVICYAKAGGELKGGERYGFIRFGSRADLYLPPDTKPAVALGDKVAAGITRMAAEK